jgi:hypothetical protein
MKTLLFGLIITILFTGLTVFGQNKNNEILVPGNPPLTRKVVNDLGELFEWVMGGNLTPQEQSDFEHQRIAEWRRNDRQSIEAAQTMLKVREKVLGLSTEKRAELLAQFQPLLVQNLQKTPDDSTSKLLLGVYYRSHSNLNSVSSRPVEQSETGNSNTGNNSSSSIVGEWAQSDTSTIGFTNRSGGTNTAGSSQVGMRFEPNGTYKSAYYVQSSMYGCTVTAFGYKTGVYHIVGSTVYLDEQTYSLSSKDSCNSSRNSEKNPPLSHIKYVFQVIRDAEGEKLALQTTTGADVFYRNTGKSMLDH